MTSLDKENATADISAGINSKQAVKDKKSRSKSLGPGGLDALQNSNGNRRKVNHITYINPRKQH
jgi:kinetochore protein Spc7/SPC105